MAEPVTHDARPRESGPEPRTPVFTVAPAEDMLYSLTADGRRKFIRPKVKRGRFWRIRRRMAYSLMALFFALPLVPVGGHPAVFLDLVNRRFHVLGGTFHPTDNLLLLAFGAGVIITVFFVGSTLGRMWCGFACPQTVYLEFLFRPLEKVARGPVRWALWFLAALAMASTFVAYFVGWGPLLQGLTSAPAAFKASLATIAGLTGLILFDFGWFRDQMCTVACPYGRLQNVLADRDTILVAYDAKRGEPRSRVLDRLKDRVYGDCVDCRSCVNACPTGTDIRRGLQLECIGSAQCVDACHGVMTGMGKEPGLIRYTSAAEQAGGRRHLWRPRTLVYLVLLSLVWGFLAVLVATRSDALIEITRGGRETYRLLPNGLVANQQRVRVTNQLERAQRFTFEVQEPAGAQLIVSESPLEVEGEELVTVNAVTTVGKEVFQNGQATARYRVTSDAGVVQTIEFLLLGPYR